MADMDRKGKGKAQEIHYIPNEKRKEEQQLDLDLPPGKVGPSRKKLKTEAVQSKIKLENDEQEHSDMDMDNDNDSSDEEEDDDGPDLMELLARRNLLDSQGRPPSWLVPRTEDVPDAATIAANIPQIPWKTESGTTVEVESTTLTFRKVWSRKPAESVNAVAVGFVRRQSDADGNKNPATAVSSALPLFGDVVAACEDGKLVFMQHDKPDTTEETKGGPILSLALHRMVPHTDTVDIIAGDAEGTVFLISDDQIIMRNKLGSPITCIEIHTDF
ncbi:hypothetical protein HK104_003513, partial [Borealophlyctis nickersoniae]